MDNEPKTEAVVGSAFGGGKTAALDELVKRQQERFAKREDPQPVPEQTPAAPPPFDASKAEPGTYTMGVVWRCSACGNDRTITDERTVLHGLQGTPMGLVCGAMLPNVENPEQPKRCGHAMACKPGFKLSRAPDPNQAMNRAERRALDHARRRQR